MGKLNPILVNALLAFFCGLILIWFTRAFPQGERVLVDKVCSLLAYPEAPAQNLRSLVQAAGNWVLERKGLQDRNRELERENLVLRASLQRLQVRQPPPSPELIAARVTLRYPEEWWKEVRVNKGARDGVRKGAPALSDGFMIGRVSRVGDDYAWIELVTSASFLLAAVVDDTMDLGVINGDDRGNVWLMYTPPDKAFEKGMTISTALVGDYLPPGIPIGRVWGEGEARDGSVPLRIASGAHLTQLYGVQILLIDGAEGAAR